MRNVFLTASLVSSLLVTVALAGAPAEQSVSVGCHGRMKAVATECHGVAFKAPASVEAAACHGRRAARITVAERAEIRSLARQNYRATVVAGRSAARKGEGVVGLEVDAPAMQLVQE